MINGSSSCLPQCCMPESRIWDTSNGYSYDFDVSSKGYSFQKNAEVPTPLGWDWENLALLLPAWLCRLQTSKCPKVSRLYFRFNSCKYLCFSSIINLFQSLFFPTVCLSMVYFFLPPLRTCWHHFWFCMYPCPRPSKPWPEEFQVKPATTERLSESAKMTSKNNSCPSDLIGIYHAPMYPSIKVSCKRQTCQDLPRKMALEQNTERDLEHWSCFCIPPKISNLYCHDFEASKTIQR